MEGISSLLRQAEGGNRISGIAIARRAPKVSHLLFADDSIIFCKANNDECI